MLATACALPDKWVAYDNKGNLTSTVPASGSATCDTFDQANRLTAIKTGSGSTCTSPTTLGTYAVDGDGLRESKTVSGTTTQFTWDGQGGNLLQQYDGTTKTSWIYGPGGIPVEQIAGSTTTYLHHDQLGSIRLITDSAGATGTATTQTWDPYGNSVSTSGSLISPFGFAGQYTDAESGLIYLRARYYDPTTAQFLTVDPAVSLTRSPYAYVAGNPLNATDRMGLGPNPPVDPGTLGESAGACAGTAEVPIVGEVTCGATAGEGALDLFSLIGDALAGTSSGAVSSALGSSLDYYFANGASSVCALSALDEAQNFAGPGGQWEGTSGGFQYRHEVSQGGATYQLIGRLDIDPRNGAVQRQGPHLNLEIQVQTSRGFQQILDEHFGIDPGSYTYSGP